MEITYRRDLDRSFMIIDQESVTGDEYTLHMLEKNDVPGFLNLDIRKINGKARLYYEITGRQNVRVLYEKIQMQIRDIRRIFQGIEDALREADRYLLDPSDILIGTEYIYMDRGEKLARMCYVPGSGAAGSDGFLELAEYMLRHLDHSDREAVDLAYAFYEMAAEKTFSFRESVAQLKKISMQPRTMEKTEKSDDMKEIGSADTAGEQNKKKDESLSRKKEKNKKRAGKKALSADTLKKNRWFLLAGLILAVIYGVIIALLGLDLSSSGALGFVMISVFWLTIGTIRKAAKPHNRWITDEDVKKEDAFLEALIADVYDMEPGQVYEDRSFGTVGAAGGTGVFLQAAAQQGQEQSRNGNGETRCLSISSEGGTLRLVSQNPRSYPDMTVIKQQTVVGRGPDGVDLRIPGQTTYVSRLHARLECSEGSWYVTDMNSRNGTYVNGDKLETEEKTAIKEGDLVGFAMARYRVKIS